ALVEVGLDWWQLAPRGGVICLLGLYLLMPWIVNGLRPAAEKAPGYWARAAAPLASALVIAVGVGIISMFIDPHGLDGRIDTAAAGAADDGTTADWPTYGGSPRGERYSPLA